VIGYALIALGVAYFKLLGWIADWLISRDDD